MAPTCSLSADGRAHQLERYARLATQAEAVEREPRALTVTFAPGFDEALLAETVAVERECCPFFEIEVAGRRLDIGVGNGEAASMLGPLAEALGASRGAAGASAGPPASARDVRPAHAARRRRSPRRRPPA